MEIISKSFGVVAKRMWDAEVAVVSIGKGERMMGEGEGDEWKTVVRFAKG
jgi:hypothetical protein